MAVTTKIKASTTMEAVVSVAMISALMVIVFPFFGQVLSSSHRMEVIRGWQLLNEMETVEKKQETPLANTEYPGEGIGIRQTQKQDADFPELYHITTEMINPDKEIVYSFTELKYLPE